MDEDSPSLQAVQNFDYDDLVVEASQVNWISDVQDSFKLVDYSKITATKFMAARKDKRFHVNGLNELQI